MGKNRDFSKFPNAITVLDNGNVGVASQIPRSGSGLKAVESTNYVIEDNGDFGFKSNAYYNGTNNIYINSAAATRMYAGSGAFEFFTAPVGTAAGTVTFTSRFYIGNTGNIGIGTSSPGYKLDVQSGSVGAFSSTVTAAWSSGFLNHSYFMAPNMTGGGLSIAFGKSNGTYNVAKIVYNHVADASSSNYIGLGFWDADNKLVVKADGTIGIGTTSPLAQLHMYNAGGTVRMRMETGSTGAALLDFYNSTTARWSIGIDNNQSYGKLENRVLSTDAIRFYDSSNNVVLVPSSGNVGIGTDAPSTGYAGTISNVRLALRNGTIGASGGTSVLLIGADNNHYSSITSQHTGGGETYLAFGTSSSISNPAERMRITSGGNIGIGMSSPGYRLEVWNGAPDVFRVVNTGSANGNNPTAQFLNSYGNHSWGICAEFRVGGSGGGDRPSILFSNGFDSNTWACGFGYADSGYFRINKDQGPYAGSWGTTLFSLDRSGNYSFAGSNVSDRRNKKDITYITESQIDNILKLKPATFVKKSPGKDEYSDYVHTGFIAQDILETGIPNLVHGNEADGYGLDYDGLFTLAVKAIQELKIEKDAEIAHLKTILNNNGITI